MDTARTCSRHVCVPLLNLVSAQTQDIQSLAARDEAGPFNDSRGALRVRREEHHSWRITELQNYRITELH
jgi:hypothetical protein